MGYEFNRNFVTFSVSLNVLKLHTHLIYHFLVNDVTMKAVVVKNIDEHFTCIIFLYTP